MKKHLFSLRKLTFLLVFAIFMHSATLAQGTYASISGKILDENSKEVPGVTLVVRNTSTGFQTGTVSNIEGSFTFRQLPLGGPYTITASYIGYTNQVKSSYMLGQGDNINVPFQLSTATTDLNEVMVT